MKMNVSFKIYNTIQNLVGNCFQHHRSNAIYKKDLKNRFTEQRSNFEAGLCENNVKWISIMYINCCYHRKQRVRWSKQQWLSGQRMLETRMVLLMSLNYITHHPQPKWPILGVHQHLECRRFPNPEQEVPRENKHCPLVVNFLGEDRSHSLLDWTYLSSTHLSKPQEIPAELDIGFQQKTSTALIMASSGFYPSLTYFALPLSYSPPARCVGGGLPMRRAHPFALWHKALLY